jgi:hypothetical protein
VSGSKDLSSRKGFLTLVKGIADTRFLVAFANRNDRHHGWAVGVAERVTEPLLTCEAVLADTAFHLQDTTVVLAMIGERLVTLAFHCDDHLQQLRALAERYGDPRPGPRGSLRHPDERAAPAPPCRSAAIGSMRVGHRARHRAGEQDDDEQDPLQC